MFLALLALFLGRLYHMQQNTHTHSPKRLAHPRSPIPPLSTLTALEALARPFPLHTPSRSTGFCAICHFASGWHLIGIWVCSSSSSAHTQHPAPSPSEFTWGHWRVSGEAVAGSVKVPRQPLGRRLAPRSVEFTKNQSPLPALTQTEHAAVLFSLVLYLFRRPRSPTCRCVA